VAFKPWIKDDGIPLIADGVPTICEFCPCVCDLAGEIPPEVQLTIPAGCGGHTGAHLLTHTGNYAAFNFATGITLEGGDPDELAMYCQMWWESTGTSGEWYFVSAIGNGGGSALLAARIEKVGSGAGFENWTPSVALSDWADMDGTTIPWFGQSGTSQCTGTPGDVLVELPP
jgi:hypothetical protein